MLDSQHFLKANSLSATLRLHPSETSMLKPPMPNIPGVNAVTDTLDFVKNLWGSMSVPGIGIPGMATPTLSVEDLDKKIADLKAVEAWLNVNVSMLRGSIQALEVQRGTIATLKSMGAALSNAVKQPGADEKSVLAAAPYASAFFAQPAAEPVAKVQPEPQSAPPAAAPMANPALWWNLLQDQFKQAVSTAMAPDTSAKLSAAAPVPGKAPAKTAAKRAPAKPRTSKPKVGKNGS
jgi:hypothetical protein